MASPSVIIASDSVGSDSLVVISDNWSDGNNSAIDVDDEVDTDFFSFSCSFSFSSSSSSCPCGFCFFSASSKASCAGSGCDGSFGIYFTSYSSSFSSAT